MRILLYGEDGIHVLPDAKSLLPLHFVAENMR